ncbi:MAG TPA: DUF3306 domain-containing protein [Pseudolabrys sp.]
MSESEKFLERWSRLKREVADDAASAPKPESQESESVSKGKSGEVAAAEPGEVKDAAAAEPFDLGSLPSIDLIDANTDIRGFMQAGVPAELKHAALRRAWSTDPQIRDFVGLVENGWDFNDPTAMHGFGPIDPRDIERLLAQVIGPAAKPEQVAEAATTKDVEVQPDSSLAHPEPERQADTTDNEGSPDRASVQRSKENVAPQNRTDALIPPIE